MTYAGGASDGRPGLARRVGFWVLLGLFSTVFAEVLFPTSLFDLVTMAVIAIPIYLLHAVVLAAIVFRTRVGYPSLYLAGVVLGLYEAYVTKAVWAPVGDPLAVPVAGVYPFELVSLVFFWHPLVAFVIPVAVVEWAATDSRRSLVPPIAGHRYALHVAVGTAGTLAVLAGTLGAGPATTLISLIVAAGLLSGALAVWRRTGGHRFAMAALLPSGRALWTLGLALVTLYVVFGATIRPGALPRALPPHLVILGLYAVVAGLFLATLRGSGESGPPPRGQATDPLRFGWPTVLTAAGAFALASAGAALFLRPVGTFVFLGYFALGPIVGLASLTAILLSLRRSDAVA